MRQNLRGNAAQHQSLQPFAPVGSHDDQISPVCFSRFQNTFINRLPLEHSTVAVDAASRKDGLGLADSQPGFFGRSLQVFSLTVSQIGTNPCESECVNDANNSHPALEGLCKSKRFCYRLAGRTGAIDRNNNVLKHAMSAVSQPTLNRQRSTSKPLCE